MNTLPTWLKHGARVWLNERDAIVGDVSEGGLVLEQRRRGFRPARRLLNPTELAAVLESGALRPKTRGRTEAP